MRNEKLVKGEPGWICFRCGKETHIATTYEGKDCCVDCYYELMDMKTALPEIRFNPKTGRFKMVNRRNFKVQFKMGWSLNRWEGSIIQETKQCSSCDSMKEAKVLPYIDSFHPSLFDDYRSTKKQAEKLGVERSKILGICIKGVVWKVLFKVEKPRKCMKV